MLQYGGAPVMEGQWCVTLTNGAFTVNFPQAGSFKLHYAITQGGEFDLVLRLSGPATFVVGLLTGDVLKSASVQPVVMNTSVSGRDMGSGVEWLWGPGDAGTWSDVCSIDPGGTEVVLLEDGQLRVAPGPEQCPPCMSSGGSVEQFDPNGTPTLVNNGNGTVTDTRTGLTWLQNASCFGALAYEGAMIAVAALASGHCGLTDGSTVGQWRLPTLTELLSLIDYSQYMPALPAGYPFTNVQSSFYWTATIYAPDPTEGTWYVHIGGGSATCQTFDFPLDKFYVWPVR